MNNCDSLTEIVFLSVIFVYSQEIDFWGPMAWTVIFGLTTATFLTLVMVPVMYSLAVRVRNRFQKV